MPCAFSSELSSPAFECTGPRSGRRGRVLPLRLHRSQEFCGGPRAESETSRVIILDHHKTALETLPRNGEGPSNLLSFLDLSKSGATVAYDYFEEKLQSADRQTLPPSLVDIESQRVNLVTQSKLQPVRALFKYIEDADLWKWNLPDSKAFSSGLDDIGLEFSAIENSEIFDQLLNLKAQDLITRGKESLKAKHVLIDDILEGSFVLALGGGQYGQCLGVRADDSAVSAQLRSELGNQLAAKSLKKGLLPIGAVIYVQPGYEGSVTEFKVSLRSIGESVDTAKISQAYGGGGHRNASSFFILREELKRWEMPTP